MSGFDYSYQSVQNKKVVYVSKLEEFSKNLQSFVDLQIQIPSKKSFDLFFKKVQRDPDLINERYLLLFQTIISEIVKEIKASVTKYHMENVLYCKVVKMLMEINKRGSFDQNLIAFIKSKNLSNFEEMYSVYQYLNEHFVQSASI